MNNTTQFVKGFKLHENVDEKFLYGDVYFIDTPYICEKKDLNKVNTRYLAGCRPELIVSGDEFNKSSSFRYTIPISTYHEKTTTLTNEKILFKDVNGRIQVLHLDEMRTRHTSDITKGESKYCYHMSKEFMNMITEKITEFTGNKFSNVVNVELNEKIIGIESKLDSLINLLNQNSIDNKEKETTTEKDECTNKKTTKNKSTKFDRWSRKKKDQFKDDLTNMTLADVSKKYKISVSSIQRYIDLYFPELREQRKTEFESKTKKNRYFKYVGTKTTYESQVDKFNRRWNIDKSENKPIKNTTKVMKNWPESKRQQFIIDIKSGKSVKQIAADYNITEQTVYYHKKKTQVI